MAAHPESWLTGRPLERFTQKIYHVQLVWHWGHSQHLNQERFFIPLYTVCIWNAMQINIRRRKGKSLFGCGECKYIMCLLLPQKVFSSLTDISVTPEGPSRNPCTCVMVIPINDCCLCLLYTPHRALRTASRSDSNLIPELTNKCNSFHYQVKRIKKAGVFPNNKDWIRITIQLPLPEEGPGDTKGHNPAWTLNHWTATIR